MAFNTTLLTIISLCFIAGYLPLLVKSRNLQIGALIIIPFVIALAVHLKDAYHFGGTEKYIAWAPKYVIILGAKGLIAMSIGWLIFTLINRKKNDI